MRTASVAGVALFDQFWAAYPRRVGKKDALRAWASLKPTQALLDEILAALEWQREAWATSDVKYTPHPATWLRAERWTDEPPAVRVQAHARVPFRSHADWTCSHTPHCGTRAWCEHLQALAEAKAS